MPRANLFLAGLLLAAGANQFSSAQTLPRGFKPLFNGKDLSGWHISQENHHGNTKAWKIEDGVLSVTQDKPGNGGILLTNARYRNFEVYLEIKPDFGCDGGLFLRSSEKGEAYQVMIDYLEGGIVGGIYGEKLNLGAQGRVGPRPNWAELWPKAWKKDDWNTLRARITGEAPHILVWINDILIADWQDTANHAAGGARDGMIALQAHFSNEKTKRWVDGGYHRYRNIGIKILD